MKTQAGFRVAALICAVAVPGAGRAETSSDVADAFGALVGSEAPCGLAFKPEAVLAAIAERVAPDDLKFNELFAANSTMVGWRIERMTPTEKLVHCATVKRNAQSLGLID